MLNILIEMADYLYWNLYQSEFEIFFIAMVFVFGIMMITNIINTIRIHRLKKFIKKEYLDIPKQVRC